MKQHVLSGAIHHSCCREKREERKKRERVLKLEATRMKCFFGATRKEKQHFIRVASSLKIILVKR